MKEYLKKWIKKYFLFAGIFSFFVNVFNLTFPLYMLAIYDRVLNSFSIPTLLTISAGALLAVIVMCLLDILRSRILILASLNIQHSLSDEVLERTIKKHARPEGPSYRYGLRDLQVLRNYLGGSAIFSIFDSPWMPIYLFVVYLIHPYLAILAVSGGIASFILGYLQAKFTSKRLETVRAIEDEMNTWQNILLTGAETITVMNMFPGILERWEERNNELLSVLDQSTRLSGIFSSIITSFRTLIPILVYGMGAYLAIQSQATPGSIIAASIITRQFLSPIDSIMATWKQTQSARGAYKRLDQLLSEYEEKPETKLPAPKGEILVEGVNFRIGDRQILSNINLKIQPGELVVIVGPSGSGKTTLCRIMLGIYKPTAGTVKIDGADILQWDKDELGKFLGYLPQDIQLFEGTVAENIARLGKIDSEEVIKAAKLAGAHEMILSLPQGYDTDIGERGAKISGGQRQKIGIARAFYGEPKFIVLDEPNSNLDDMGEKALVAGLKALKERKSTIVVVSHRPSVLSIADKVLVLKEGRIVMFGPTKQVLQALMGQPAKQAQRGEVRYGR